MICPKSQGFGLQFFFKTRKECQPCWLHQESMGGGATSPTKPEKGRAVKRKKMIQTVQETVIVRLAFDGYLCNS